MFVPFHGDGVISQFEGYEELEELDWDAYRAKYGNVQRLDRILRAEGDDPNRYKVAKQADTVMLFFLFSDAELRRLFERLGYEYGPDTARRTIEYYDQRTSHGSTLSFIVHAAVLASIDPESSWERFLVALESDIGDVQGGTTPEGIHLGVMSGTLDLVQRIYLGADDPRRNPVLHAQTDRTTRRAVVLDARFAGRRFRLDSRRRRAYDHGAGARVCSPPHPGRRRGRRPGAWARRACHVRAPARPARAGRRVA